MKSKNPQNKQLLVLLFAFLSTRIVYMFLSKRDWIYDQFEYGEIAHNFLRTGHLVYNYYGKDMPTACEPPALIFLFIFLNKFFSKHLFMAFSMLHLAVASGAFVLFQKLSRRLLNKQQAFLACLLYIFDVNLFSITRWANETLYSVFLIVLLWIYLIKTSEGRREKNLTFLGAVLGIGLLFRDVYTVYCGFVLVCLLVWGYKLKDLLKVFILAFLIISPWIARNYIVLHKFIPVTHQLGEALWRGWSPKSVGAMYQWDGEPMPREPSLAKKLEAANSEAEMESIYAKSAIDSAIKNPLRWVKQRMLGCFFFWHEQAFWAPKSRFHTKKNRVLGIFNLLLIGVFFLSLPRAWNSRPLMKAVIAFIFMHSLIYIAVHADIGNRYRLQIEPLILLTIAAALRINGQERA